jgi:hypothetical protein
LAQRKGALKSAKNIAFPIDLIVSHWRRRWWNFFVVGGAGVVGRAESNLKGPPNYDLFT